MSNTILVGIINELVVQGDGWAMLAPYGDFPGTAIMTVNGKTEKVPAIQRLDQESVGTMVNEFKSFLGKVKRKFVCGRKLYVGHPDVAALANDYRDKQPKGVFVDLEAREDGLWGKPVLTEDGADLVESGKYRHMSAHWNAVLDNEDTDKGLKVFRPIVFVSAGLTNSPNLPVKPLQEAEMANDLTNNDKGKSMIDLVKFFTRCGIANISNEKTEEHFEDVIKLIQGRAAIVNERDGLATSSKKLADDLAAMTIERDGLKSKVTELEGKLTAKTTEFSNERTIRISDIIARAIESGRITEAERKPWEEKLQADFANESQAIQKLKPKMKVTASALSQGLGDRKVTIANAVERSNKVQSLVSAKMASGMSYDDAFKMVERENPALFAEMKQPSK